MIDPQQHAEHRNAIESILRYIPGFRGYLEQDYRQESDRLTRTHLADRLQQGRRSLDEYLRGLVDAGMIDRLPAWERVKTRLEGLILKLRGAVRGYRGVFDFVRVNVRLLDAVYAHDMALLQEVEELVRSLDQLATRQDSAETAAQLLLQQVDAVDRKFAQRGDLLKGLGAEPGTTSQG